MDHFMKLLLILILVLCVAMLLSKCGLVKSGPTLGGNTPRYTGGFDTFDYSPYTGGAPTDVAEGVYNSIKEHLDNVGTAKHIEGHLADLLDVKKVEISAAVQTMHSVKESHKKLMELLIIAAERTGADSPQELILLFDISYQWFLPTDKRKALLAAKFPKNNENYKLIEEVVRKTAENMVSSERDNIVKKVMPVSVLYKKFNGDISKKTANTLKRSSDVSIDTVGVSGIVKLLADSSGKSGYVTSSAPQSIRDKLDSIDLIKMYTREPYLVKSFIERIKRDVKTIEYNTDPLQYSLAPLTSLLALTQREINDQEQRRLANERRDLEKQRRDLVNQAIKDKADVVATKRLNEPKDNIAADNYIARQAALGYTPAPHRASLGYTPAPHRDLGYTPAPHRDDLNKKDEPDRSEFNKPCNDCGGNDWSDRYGCGIITNFGKGYGKY